ncbi:MAG: acetylpolyamine amidohydrolase, partial [Deltaproteobacteria bacterium]|nr:acetylpolyamine amidohydrolase [Deltaproteobacteria bacterium]
MFRIRRIYDDTLPRDREAVIQVQAILRSQFAALDEQEVAKLPLQLRNPVKYRFKSILFVADGLRGDVKGFALLQHAADVGFCYLDYVSIEAKRPGRGVGGALYDRVREEAAALTEVGLFFECLPDDPVLCRNEAERAQSKKRLRFYERYGAYPIVNTAYETPFKP